MSCSAKVQVPDSEALKPAWLKTEPYQDGYYTGIGHSLKAGSGNYIQEAKKSALEDLVSEIKVNVSSTSILSQLEVDKKLSEQYEQIIKTTAADEIEEFEMVDAWEDESNYWVYYRLSISRYRQIKEEQKRNATILAKDYLIKGKDAESAGQRVAAINYYFQALRSIEKYFGEAIHVDLNGKDVLLVNEVYSSIQKLLDLIQIQANPSGLLINRRVQQTMPTVIARVVFTDSMEGTQGLPLKASFMKGAGEVFPSYQVEESGQARILINKISSKEIEQSIAIGLDMDAMSGKGSSPIYELISKTFHCPSTNVLLKVERPVVFFTIEEKTFGSSTPHHLLGNKLKNLLANNGFEFTEERPKADLWFDVKTDSEKGSVSGSIYITYLTSIIKVTALKEGREIYATTLDRIKGYGLDYNKSNYDAYNKAMETLEKEKINELLNTVLQ